MIWVDEIIIIESFVRCKNQMYHAYMQSMSIEDA
jgi:hypothetical protein